MVTPPLPSHPDPDELLALARAVAAGDGGAAEELCSRLTPALRNATSRFLRDDEEAEDVVQETLLAVLNHVRAEAGFSGHLARFAVTVASNRCRNLLLWRRRRSTRPLEPLAEWIAHPDRSPLDALIDTEARALMQEALDRLGPDCRALLRAFYLEGQPIERIRRAVGLSTVQGVYYRRALCLERAARFLKERLADCSPGETRPADDGPDDRGGKP
jgi:RNA polymerase sigma factor (sigma-70 family)